MKKLLLPLALLSVSAAVMVLLFGASAPPEQKPEEKKVLLVEVISVQPLSKNLTVNSQGTVEPKIKSSLVSEVSGKITWISEDFVKGGLFESGQILMRIDDADYKTAVKTAEAALARATATLEEEKARAQVAEREWQQFMQGKAPDLYIRKPQLAREVANVNAAEADLERAKRDLERTKVRASFNGLVKQKQADLGQFVNRGTAVAEVYGTDVAQVRLPVSDLDVEFLSFDSAFDIKTQQPKVDLHASFGSSVKHWSATIVRSEGVIDERNRLVYLVAEVNDPYGTTTGHNVIEFGRFVEANIEGKSVQQLVVIPRDLVFEQDKVLLANDNKIEIRAVNIAKRDKQFAYVESGLIADEKVISTNIKNPIVGTEIKILNELSSMSQDNGAAQ